MAKKILIIDDESLIGRVLRGYFEAAGFSVVAAYDGTQAMAAFRHEMPDLIVLDLTLPEASQNTTSAL
jgi:DNA-binding response OmpR family regulator